MTLLFSEIDRHAAAWLRELYPEASVNENSITDLLPSDVAGFRRVHLFAGIAGWQLALQLAGWPDDREVFTGSCPCQPFSCAGKGEGQKDERHLWPEMFRLIRECRPDVVFGEQVASAVAHGWLDGVFADLEGAGYTCGAVVLGAHSAGAPHIRQRIYWVAESNEKRHDRREDSAESPGSNIAGKAEAVCLTRDSAKRMANSNVRNAGSREQRLQPVGGIAGGMGNAPSGGLGIDGSTCGSAGHIDEPGEIGGLADTEGQRRSIFNTANIGAPAGEVDASTNAGNLLWSDFDFIPCRDNKTRRIERGTFPLVNGLPRGVVHSSDTSIPITAEYAKATAEARVMRLRGYGNAIIPQVAAMFIRAYMDSRGIE